MARNISLVAYRLSPTQRAHFAIFIPSLSNNDVGTIIHVVGAPMAGYQLEFKRHYAITLTQRPYMRYPIGQIDAQYIQDDDNVPNTMTPIRDSTPKGAVEIAASQIPPPRISQNFMASVNDTTNKRCQEWTMEYVRRLVELGYLGASAIDIVHSKRDPPSHGIGLRPVAVAGNR